jgi:hypothetical protein
MGMAGKGAWVVTTRTGEDARGLRCGHSLTIVAPPPLRLALRRDSPALVRCSLLRITILDSRDCSLCDLMATWFGSDSGAKPAFETEKGKSD